MAIKKTKKPQPKPQVFSDNQKQICVRCGLESTGSAIPNHFYISYSKFHTHNNRVHLCKKCIVENSVVGDEFIPEKFVEVIRQLDKPFLNNILEASIKEVYNNYCKEFPDGTREDVIKYKAESIVGTYIKNVCMPQYKSLNFQLGEQCYIDSETTGEFIAKYGEDFSMNDLVYKWGEYSEAELLFLEKRLDALTSMANVEFESDIMVLKQICLEELDLRNIRKNGGTTKDKLDSIQKLMATANIRPTDIKNANSDLLNDSYGKWLNTIEETEPAEYFSDKPLFDDFDNIRKYFIDWVIRPLKNLLKGTRDFTIEDRVGD